MKNLFYTVSMLTIWATIGLILLVTYWLVWPYKTVTINGPVTTQESVYFPRQMMGYVLDYCKHSNVHAQISRSFVDGVIYSMPDITAINPVGCRKVVINLQVPNLPTGKYKLRISYTYKVNPIRTMTTTFFTNEFILHEATKGAEIE